VTSAATYVIELLVGVGCLCLAAPLWRRPRFFRAVAVLFAFAGLLAVAHALVELAR
jgi:hypothetical protein